MGTKIPPFPLTKISEGPVEQFVEIINLLSVKASSNTLGNPSYNDDKTNKSDFNI